MIAITGGGTGGHLTIAKAIKEELNRRGIYPIFIGSTYGQDRSWFENDKGWKATYFFDTSGVVNKKGFRKVSSLTNILNYSLKVRDIFKKEGIEAVFSVGGYSAAPASFGAILWRKKFYIHEQNSRMGKLNKILSPFAKQLFSTYLYGDPYPVRESFFQKARERSKLETIIFLGGSQGAKRVNDFAMEVVKSGRYRVIHQTGERDFERCQNFYRENGLLDRVEFFKFDNNLVDRMVEADLAVSRAGASTLFELVSNQLPTIFIPYPYASQNHQYYNAKWVADKGLGFVKMESELDLTIFDKIDNKTISYISHHLKELNSPFGAKLIVDRLLG